MLMMGGPESLVVVTLRRLVDDNSPACSTLIGINAGVFFMTRGSPFNRLSEVSGIVQPATHEYSDCTSLAVCRSLAGQAYEKRVAKNGSASLF